MKKKIKSLPKGISKLIFEFRYADRALCDARRAQQFNHDLCVKAETELTITYNRLANKILSLLNEIETLKGKVGK